MAVIRGWSFSSEIDPATMLTGGSVSLDPGLPEIIFFFDVAPNASEAPDASLASGPLEFRYRLDDYDADWTITQGLNAHYRRLTPGHYQFEVQAHIKGTPWPATMAALPVHQQPFFYQTWYFYLLLLLGMVALAAQMLTQRDQLLKGQMGMVLEERNRIASDCHDTLMAGFAAISWQLEATAKLFRESNASDTPAANSCELARSMVSHCQAEARRIIWDLRDPDEVTNILSQALSRAITAHRLRESVETTFDVDGDEISIAPGAVHHLVCIGQEAVTNAIRHADASSIHIGLRYDIDSLSLSIRDNGHGFHVSSPTPRTGHFGIAVMEERARKLGGTLRLNSSSDAGTEVIVTVSFESINLPGNLQQHVVPWIGV
jgi:signal transduction histidine kinase